MHELLQAHVKINVAGQAACREGVTVANLFFIPLQELPVRSASSHGPVCVGIERAVNGCDTAQMRRVLYCHKPLHGAGIGSAHTRHLSIGPGLCGDPFDQFVLILLAFPSQEFEISSRFSGPPDIGYDHVVAQSGQPCDIRSGWGIGESAFFCQRVGAGHIERGIAGAYRWIEYPDTDFHTIAHDNGGLRGQGTWCLHRDQLGLSHNSLCPDHGDQQQKCAQRYGW